MNRSQLYFFLSGRNLKYMSCAKYMCILQIKTFTLQMKNLENISTDVAMETRDGRGNTLLHRCVEMGSSNCVYMILDRFPGLSSDMNDENMTAIELAVKVSK